MTITYNILRDGVVVGTSPVTSFTDTGLAPSTTYTYTVEAVDEAGTSAQSLPVMITTLSGGGGTVTAVTLNGNTAFTQVMNAGAFVGAITVTLSPPGTYTGQVMLGGPDAALFALTNGGFLPTNLIIGAANVGPGSYNITLTAN